MAGRLDPRASQVHVPKLTNHHRFLVVVVDDSAAPIFRLFEDPEKRSASVGDAFRGDIDVALPGQRGGADPEDFLLEEPGDEGRRESFVEGAHGLREERSGGKKDRQLRSVVGDVTRGFHCGEELRNMASESCQIEWSKRPESQGLNPPSSDTENPGYVLKYPISVRVILSMPTSHHEGFR